MKEYLEDAARDLLFKIAAPWSLRLLRLFYIGVGSGISFRQPADQTQVTATRFYGGFMGIQFAHATYASIRPGKRLDIPLRMP
jgi:hypothetical protein